jgi:hypothetical protein
MSESTVETLRPAHETFPDLIRALILIMTNTKDRLTLQAYESAFSIVCVSLETTMIPPKHLDEVIHRIEAMAEGARKCDFTIVLPALEEIILSLKARPLPNETKFSLRPDGSLD